jgi:serine/threonine-protein kinase
MAILAGFRADQLINQLVSEPNANTAKAQKTIAKLTSLGPAIVPNIIEALATTDKENTSTLATILASLVSDKSLKYFIEGLADGGERVVAATTWALRNSHNFDANSLLEHLANPEVSKPAVIEILKTHQSSLNVHELLRRAYEMQPKEKAALFKIIDAIATEDLVPDLINRMDGKDPAIKIHLIGLLSKFHRAEINRALETQLDDTNRHVRSAALNALATRDEGVNVKRIGKLLTDADVEVQNQAVDVLVKLRHPDTLRLLIPALKAESEYARRAAVEVLNEICDPTSIKELLDAIRDEDWWVRARAGDALAEIGGPKVLDAVLELISDKDEDIRRTSIEILNSTKDERAVDHLLKATDDSDWWVRERAIDALSQIGDKKAIPKLVGMLGKDTKTDSVLVRALGKIGDDTVIDKIVPLLNSEDKNVRVEVVRTLSHLASEKRVDSLKTVLTKIKQSDDGELVDVADKAIKDMDARFAPVDAAESMRAEKIADHTKTLLVEDQDIETIITAAQEKGILDISTLQPGDVVDGRYKFIEKIGKGAFGTVLLMQDQVVEERLILKFLNPNVSSDEEMMKRFVHELRYSRKITHRNVIRIYDFLHLQGCYAISMEYFPSHTLSAEIPDNKPMDFKKALQYSYDMATGMSVAHQAGVIHRDLKPANILVNDEGLLKIVDFGVAAAATSGGTELTKTGYVIGSPKYMAPEQILGKKVDETADIYSIGVIMYEMVTGIPPYSRGDHMSVMYQHVQGKAKGCQEVNPEVPDDFAALITKAMSVDKTKRFASMVDLMQALDNIKL